MSKVIGVMWFTACGIVRVKTEFGFIKYYIRGVRDWSDEQADAEFIANWGSSFPKEAGDALFGVSDERQD